MSNPGDVPISFMSVSTSNGKGIAGRIRAGKLAMSEFFRIVRHSSQIWIQLGLGAFVVVGALLRTFVLDIGFGFYSWIILAIVISLGVKAEVENTVHERTGDAVAAIVVALRSLPLEFVRLRNETSNHDVDPSFSKGEIFGPLPDGASHEWNLLTKRIKDGGAATVSPMFFMALIVDLALLIHG